MDGSDFRQGELGARPNPQPEPARPPARPSRAAPTRSTWPGGPRSPRSRPPTCRANRSRRSRTCRKSTRCGRSSSRELRVKHEKYACAEYLAATDRLALPTDRVPQLGQVTGRLQWLTGFRLEPVPGLVPTRTFYGALAERRFLSTQYMRHHSVPFYTPEPDIVHELVGHANMLASPMFAALYQAAGLALASRDHARRARVLQPGVLVHARVRRPVGRRRAAHVRRRPPVVVR